MSKYKELVVYSGNLMKYTNGQSILYEEDVYLAYDQNSDTFSCLNYTLNCYIDLLRNDLSEEEKEKCRKIIREHTYPYFNSGLEEQVYVDEDSICVVADSNEQKSSKAKG